MKTTVPGRVLPGTVNQSDFGRPPGYRTFLRNLMPFVAISFVVGSMRRQIAAARAMTFTSVVKLSMTTSPL